MGLHAYSPLFYFSVFWYAKTTMKKVIALDLGGTSLKGAIVDEDGSIGIKQTEQTEGLDKDGVVAAVVKMIEDLAKEDKRITTVGMGMPGPLDPHSGVVLVTPNLPFKEPFPMKEYLEKQTGLDVHINNDANMAVLGEQWMGAAKGAKTVVMLTLGTGIGGGLIIDGKLFDGSRGLGAELGHVTISSDEQSGGNFERLASASALVKKAQEQIDPQISDALHVEDLAHEGNEMAKKIYEDEGRYLGIAIANYINIFNPEFVILGGGMAKGWDLFEETMREEVAARAFPMIAQSAQILPAELGNDAGLLGAAKLALEV